jgi:hypothetical protein
MTRNEGCAGQSNWQLFFVCGQQGSEAIVNKRLWINPGPAAAKKYYEKGRLFLKFGTAFG